MSTNQPFDIGQRVTFGRNGRQVGVVSGYSEDLSEVLLKNEYRRYVWRKVESVANAD